jgi:hypothetical protein
MGLVKFSKIIYSSATSLKVIYRDADELKSEKTK